MKNRKSILVVFAILALLCLGIGYAALTDSVSAELTIKGNGGAGDTVEEDLFNIKWISESIDDSDTHNQRFTITSNINEDGSFAELGIDGFAVAGDTVEVVYALKNETVEEGGLDAKLKLRVEGMASFSESLSLQYSFVEAADSEMPADQVLEYDLAYEETVYVYIVVSVSSSLLTDSDVIDSVLTFVVDAEATE